MLLFHGLGSGKSASSLAAAEGFLQRHRKVFVMLPASLAPNYRKEILSHAYLSVVKRGRWTEVSYDVLDDEKMKAIMEAHRIPRAWLLKKKGKAWLPVEKGAPVGEGSRWKELTDEAREKVNETLDMMIDSRFEFIHYNGLTRDQLDKLTKRVDGKDTVNPFDNSFVVIDEAHNFISRVTNRRQIPYRVYKLLMQAKGMKIVLLSGTPMINHPFELCHMMNLVRGPQYVQEWTLSKSKASEVNEIKGDLSSEAVRAILMKDHQLKHMIDHVQVDIKNASRKLYITLLPAGFRWNKEIDLLTSSDQPIPKMQATQAQIRDVLAKAGLTAHEKVNIHGEFALPDDLEEFQNLFLEEYVDNDEPKARVKNSDLFMRRVLGVVSYYRSAGEDMFPSVSDTIFEEVPMSDYQYGKYLEVRYRELHMELARKRRARGEQNSLFDNKGSVYRAFSRMLCNFAFPEMEHKRLYPMDVRVSLKRELDMLREDGEEDVKTETEVKEKEANAGAKAAQAAQTAQTAKQAAYKKQEAAVLKALKSQTTKDGNVVFKDNSDKVQKVYETMIDRVMTELETRGAEFLTPEQLPLYSPKFAKMVTNIEASPGKSLMYSQFRNVEGLGLFAMVLRHRGWVEIKLKKVGGVYRIANAKTVMDPKFNKRRFIRFPEDRTEQKILLNLYNGAYDNLPGNIKGDTAAAIIGDKDEELKIKKNLYGDFVSLLMITQSGAEGISLKNVRQVHITESFWQSVRIDQVIGRAVRACSHDGLPKEERNVKVYMYVSTFTPKQGSDFTIRQTDHSLTSDQHLLELSKQKDDIVGQFLKMLKIASVDCVRNARFNNPREQGFQCYSFPLQLDKDDFAVNPRLTKDELDDQRMSRVRNRSWKGQVVLDPKTNKKYVRKETDAAKMYQYDAYVNAGVLVPI